MLYFDYAATTPVDGQVVAAMAPFFTEEFYNPSSLYTPGKKAGQAIQKARGQVAALIGAEPEEILFTSGGTEADNTALIGAALAARKRGSLRRKLVVSAIEHHAVLETCRFLETLGFETVLLPVDPLGRVLPETLAEAVGPDTAVVSVMWVNNEIGTIQDIPTLAAVAHRAGALFHTDAVQALGTQPVDFHRCGADLMSISSHKIYGPKGCGALAVRTGVELPALLHGGQQEGGRRGGTENVPAIVGFGKAAHLLSRRWEADARQMLAHKLRVLAALASENILCLSPPETAAPSMLAQWPVQLRLVPVCAPFFDGCDLLIAADCAAYAYADFHRDYMAGHVTLIGCPKLNQADYAEKLTEIIRENDLRSVTVVRMEVPCCGGIEQAAKTAIMQSGKFLPWQVVTVGVDGRILS